MLLPNAVPFNSRVGLILTCMPCAVYVSSGTRNAVISKFNLTRVSHVALEIDIDCQALYY